MNAILVACLSSVAVSVSSCTPKGSAGTPGIEGQSPVREPTAARAPGGRDAIRMQIHHYRVPCIGEAVQLCYLVKIGDQAAWELFYGAIDGFTSYQWGHTYDILVVREEVEHPPQDASSVRHVLARVVSDEPVPKDTEFSFTLRTDEIRPYVTGSPQAGFRLLGELAIRCETEEVCTAFSRALETGQTVRATFRHTGEGGTTVQLLSLIEA